MNQFKRGLRLGIPICLGYVSVSFTFGIMAVALGFSWWQAVIISALTMTSAGQLAGIQVMSMPGQYITMLISQATINLRYSFMGISLSQKASPKFKRILKIILGFFITDEIFAVASGEEELDPKFFFGLAFTPHIGWTVGTLIGGIVGNVLPETILNALCLAIYGMFIAIIIPPAKKSVAVLITVLIAAAMSSAFYFAPLLSSVSSGIAISISAVAAAALAAILFPIDGGKNGESEAEE